MVRQISIVIPLCDRQGSKLMWVGYNPGGRD